jgi:hypothetical protein
MVEKVAGGTMKSPGRVLLVLGAASSLFVAGLHLAIIAVGPRWYRYFGAPSLAAQVEGGSLLMPTLLTLATAGVFALWGFYALSAIGVVRRLPLLRTALVFIGVVYVLRGLLLLPQLAAFASGSFGSPRFLVFSAFALLAGACYLWGAVRAWKSLRGGASHPA